MSLEIINKIKTDSSYEILRENKILNQNAIIIGLGGSYAYGTNVTTSDIDIRGCYSSPLNELLTMNYTEQIEYKEKDIIIYNIKKFVNLASKGSFNVLEILGNRPDDYIYISDFGRELIKNQKIFLSKNIYNSISGFCNKAYHDLRNSSTNNKDASHLNKYAMHIVRLYYMGIDIIQKHKIITYRKNEHDLLMNIRNGKYLREDRTFSKEYFEMVDELKNTFNNAFLASPLPEKPKYSAIEKILVDINCKEIREHILML